MTSWVRPRFLFPLIALTSLASSAFADDAADRKACLDASAQAQTLRDAHKLLEARTALRSCAQPVCPSVVRRDCATWLDGVESVIPTIVPSFKDGEGNDLFDAVVTMDGVRVADRETGDAISVDPGPHTFRFTRPDGTSVGAAVLVPEGAKSLPVAAHLPPPPKPVVPRPGATPLRLTGWVVGGVGAAGLVVGGVFGGLAIADKSSGSCNASNRCTNYGAITSAKTAANVSDVGLIAGGALAAAGVALVVVGGSSRSPTSGWLSVSPAVATNESGVIVRGAW